MKKRQKIYNDEQSILRDIDATIAKSKQLFIDSEALKQEGHRLIRTGHEGNAKLGKENLKEAAKMFKAAERCQAKLDRMKQALSAFKTETMPFQESKQVVY